MDRRSLLKAGMTSGLALGAPSVVTAATKKVYRWRLVMVIPKTMPMWGPAVQRFADAVKKMSQGSLRIKVYGAGELVPPLGTFDAVSSGKVEMAHSAAAYWIGRMPAAPFFTSI